MNMCSISFLLVSSESQTTKLIITVQCDEYNDACIYRMLRKYRGENTNQTTWVFKGPSL